MPTSQGGGKNKKYGRNKAFATRYAAEHRYDKNKRKAAERNPGPASAFMPAGGKPHPARSQAGLRRNFPEHELKMLGRRIEDIRRHYAVRGVKV